MKSNLISGRKNPVAFPEMIGKRFACQFPSRMYFGEITSFKFHPDSGKLLYNSCIDHKDFDHPFTVRHMHLNLSSYRRALTQNPTIDKNVPVSKRHYKIPLFFSKKVEDLRSEYALTKPEPTFADLVKIEDCFNAHLKACRGNKVIANVSVTGLETLGGDDDDGSIGGDKDGGGFILADQDGSGSYSSGSKSQKK